MDDYDIISSLVSTIYYNGQWPTKPGQGLVVGNPTGGNMGAGSINIENLYVGGEPYGVHASVIVPSVNAVALPNGTPVNVASVPIPGGYFKISGELWIGVSSGTPSIQTLAGAITETSATIPSDPAENVGVNLMEINQSRSAGTGAGFILPISTSILTITTPGTLYLVAQASWTGAGSLMGYGQLLAFR
jgi:hypothetical protein